MSPIAWAVILVLILVTALYVAAEFAAVSVRRTRLRQRAEDGDRLARRMLPYVEDPHRLDRYIAASQVGITVSSLVLGAYGQAAIAPDLVPLFERFGGVRGQAAESAAATVVLVALTILSMILGELVPKSLALQFPTAMARYTVLPMLFSLRAMGAFITFLNGSGNLLLRMLGVRAAGHGHIHSPDEIEYLIAQSKEGGYLRGHEQERLARALHLETFPVERIMVPRVRVEAVPVETPFLDLVRIAAESPYTRLPVYEGSLDRILGFVHVRDVARWSLERGRAACRDLVRPLAVVPAGLSAERALERLREARQHMALVVDEFGGTAGIVTLGDVLDEIFGGTPEEFEGEEEGGVERLPDGRVRLPGALRLDAAAAWLGDGWAGEAQTVAGWVLERLGHIPEAGERFETHGVGVEVEAVEHHAVARVVVRPRPPERGEGEREEET